MDSWTPPRPDGSPSDHPLWLCPNHKLIKLCHGVERYLYIIADVDADVEVGVEHYS